MLVQTPPQAALFYFAGCLLSSTIMDNNAISWRDLTVPEDDFDIAALHAALDTRRTDRGISWAAVAREVNRADQRFSIHPVGASTITAETLRNMRRQQRTGFPHVMRLARWLHCPVAALTRVAG